MSYGSYGPDPIDALICHRDLKLENTLLDGSPAPRLKICEFGYSNQRNSSEQKGKEKGRGFSKYLPLSRKMAEEDAKSEVQGPSADQNPNSVEATIESSVGCGATESTCNNNGNSAESSAVTHEGEREKSLEYAEELMARGSKAAKERDYAEATDCYSRALEIRVAHFGELSPECVTAYYKYGCALLYKAQEEADPLGSMPKKEDVSQEDSNKDGSVKIAVNGESSAASVSNNAEQGGSANCSDDAPENRNLVYPSEDSYLTALSWKMLDVARAIVEKLSGDTMEKVDILSALAEVALEREDVETSMSDYLKALSILERLVEPDSDSLADKEAEIETLTGLCSELEKKLEDLQHLVSNPKSILSDILGMMSAKAKGTEKTAVSVAMSSSQMGTAGAVGSTSSATVSTAHTNGAASGVTHLGVVGRGVKRVVMSSTVQSSPTKKPTIEPSSNNGDGSTS
ncbi:hypothetical protein DH2020_037430 [Rehmannia glutinosa]|uniref:Protein kinase domain-containing protein n=1 Tax=Rehmannia glutinosa TaxID=99300 RepID=A0ABR0V2V5_REHGL